MLLVYALNRVITQVANVVSFRKPAVETFLER